MSEPAITIICSGNEIPAAKWLAIILGKHIYARNDFSAKLISNYSKGQQIRPEEYKEAAEIFSLFFRSR